MWCQLTANVFSEFLLLQFRDMLLIFLLYGFSKHVHISVLSLCVFVRLYCFFVYFSLSMLVLPLILCISALLVTAQSNSKERNEEKKMKEGEHDLKRAM